MTESIRAMRIRKSIQMTIQKLKIILVLVKRDYAIQFAGSLLGIFWSLVQNLVLIGVYSVVFFLLDFKSAANNPDYIPHIFSGLLFWLPISDFLIRGTGILTENRNLIKRSPLGMQLFIWVPYVQYLIHHFVTSIPVFIILYFLSALSAYFIFSYFVAACTGLYLLLVLNYLSRLNIILKDISPLVRLASQFVFWTLPVLYFPGGSLLQTINSYNPLNLPLELFRIFTLKVATNEISILPFLLFTLLFLLTYYLSKTRLNKLVTDHL